MRNLFARALIAVTAASGVAWLVLRGTSWASLLAFMIVGLPALLLRLPQEQRPPKELTGWHALAVIIGFAAVVLAICARAHFLNDTSLPDTSTSAPTALSRWLMAGTIWGVVTSSTLYRVRRLAAKNAA